MDPNYMMYNHLNMITDSFKNNKNTFTHHVKLALELLSNYEILWLRNLLEGKMSLDLIDDLETHIHDKNIEKILEIKELIQEQIYDENLENCFEDIIEKIK